MNQDFNLSIVVPFVSGLTLGILAYLSQVDKGGKSQVENRGTTKLLKLIKRVPVWYVLLNVAIVGGASYVLFTAIANSEITTFVGKTLLGLLMMFLGIPVGVVLRRFMRNMMSS